MQIQDDELHVTVWDRDGNVVVDETCKCETASQVQIDEMVRMIESGTPAHVAAYLVQGLETGEGL